MFINRLAALAFFMVIATGETLAGGVPDQEWPCKIGQKSGVLRLENGVFQFAVTNDNGNVTSSYAGTVGDYEPDSAGFYVGNLDGSGTTSVALYEKRQHVWYYGVFGGGDLLTFRPLTGETFQVGDGPILYPVDGSPSAQAASSSRSPRAELQSGATVQPVFPFHVEQYTSLATSRNMDTNVTVIADGSMYAVTKVHNGVWLTGYHGRAQVTLLGANGPLYSYNSPSIGVTGTAFGSPDATAAWQVQIPSNLLTLTRYVSIYQKWDPDFTTFIRDIGPWLDFIIKIEQAVTTAVTAATHK